MCTIANLTAVPCDTNTPGTTQTGYMIPTSEITTDAAYTADTDEGDYVIADTAHVLSTTVGKGFFRSFPMLINKNSYAISAVGGIGSKGWKETFTFVLAGVNEQQLEFATRMLNIPGQWICTDKVGKVHVIGRKNDPAYVETAEGTTGDGPETERIITVTVSGYTARPMILTAAIDTTPAT